MATRLVHLVVDAADPGALARFWAAALGWPVTYKDPVAVITPPEEDTSQAGQLPLVFVPVDDPKTSKNRVHLDLASRSAEDQVASVARLEELGARKLDIGQGPDVTWEVMADPEGNELCVVSHAGSVGADPASAFGSLWPVAAVVLDSPDPDAIAPFWAEATGWPILGSDGTHVWLRDTTSDGPYLDIRRNDDPKTTKLRVHFDVVPHPTDDHATERVRALRAEVLKNPRAATAHQALSEQIAERLETKKATLGQLRRALGLTQAQLAEMLDLGQGDISRLERRRNLYLNTLARFVEATGGRLRISAIYGETEVTLDLRDVGENEHPDQSEDRDTADR